MNSPPLPLQGKWQPQADGGVLCRDKESLRPLRGHLPAKSRGGNYCFNRYPVRKIQLMAVRQTLMIAAVTATLAHTDTSARL